MGSSNNTQTYTHIGPVEKRRRGSKMERDIKKQQVKRMKRYQMEMVSLEMLIEENHIYRRFVEVFDFSRIENRLKRLEKGVGRTGYGMERLFKCLLYQFMEDLSDRQMEEALKSNVACKWFCGFGLSEKTPDYSLFCHIRRKIGTKELSELFGIMKEQMMEKWYMSEVFTFVDSSHLITKANMWRERDKAIKAKYDKLNNEVLPKVARDKDARIVCKGKGKYWYGFKKHVSCDMQSGLINKVVVTGANVNDAKALKHICPSGGAVFGDKGYCTAPARKTAAINNVHLAAIRTNNMKTKNKEQDKWYSKLRSPYERVFSKCNKHARYIGIAKNQFAEFIWAIGYNLRILATLPPRQMPTIRV